MGQLHTDPGGTNNPAYLVSETAYAQNPHIPWHTYIQPAELDCRVAPVNAAAYEPWTLTQIVAAGTLANNDQTVNNPGVWRFTSSASANSGYGLLMGASSLVMGGGETTEIIFLTPPVLTSGIAFMGFLNGTTIATAPTNGAWIGVSNATATGYTANGSNTTTIGTTYTVTAATWYRAYIFNNSANTTWTLQIFTMGGTTPVWNQSSSTYLPTTTSHGFITGWSAAAATQVMSLDYINVQTNRALTR